MKRTYISPEFEYKPIYGSFTMEESGAFFGSKMLNIENEVNVLNENLIYNQLLTGEQIDEASELNLPQIIYDSTVNKKVNHTITLDLNQTDFQKENFAKWEMKVEIKDILRNHLFAILKNTRTFEGLKSDMVLFGGIDNAIFDYINRNILSRYAYKKMDIFIDYLDLCNDGTLQYNLVYDSNIESDSTKIQTFFQDISPDETFITATFNQEKPAYAWTYKYYFNIYFEKL